MALTRRIRSIATTPPAAQAVVDVLTEESPEPDVQELRLALRLVVQLTRTDVDDPMRLVRTLYRLSSHPELRDSALIALRSGSLLFRQMTQRDRALREEARTIFEAIATLEHRARFVGWTKLKPGRWSKLRNRFGR